LKLETENVDVEVAFANFFYRARKHLDWDFQEKRIPRNVWAWAYRGGGISSKIRRRMSNGVYDKSL